MSCPVKGSQGKMLMSRTILLVIVSSSLSSMILSNRLDNVGLCSRSARVSLATSFCLCPTAAKTYFFHSSNCWTLSIL